MAQAVNLALGKTNADSTDKVVAAGATATVGIYTDDAGGLTDQTYAYLYQKTPSQSNLVARLNRDVPSVTVNGPNTYFVRRVASQSPVNVGVFSE